MSEKLYAPAYYERFSCIADKCRHSCCVNWEIDVDDRAVEKYASSPHSYAATVLSSIDEGEEGRHFALLPDGRCPHLDERGLCNVILHMGQEHLCHICREHPRFYHQTEKGREVGLGMCCEEACRLILSSDDFHSFVEVEQNVRETDSVPLPLTREKVYRILSAPTLSYRQKRQRIEDNFAIPHDLFEDGTLIASLEELEYLEKDHRALLVGYDG
ncbi:MAG: flagellin lysine-N-methylase, partial [Clostridia bacterium]|nr:flagellin lysine-N-methylase [Clostridia bacterium]